MRLHLPVTLFRAVFSGMVSLAFAVSSSAATYSKGQKTYNTRQMSALTLEEYAGIAFRGIYSSGYGGAVYNSRAFTLCGNGDVAFSSNSASFGGGAIYNSGTFTLSGNKSVAFSSNSASFNNNSASYGGGAICNRGTFLLSDNESAAFSGNSASFGGSIYNYSNFTLSNNESVTFSAGAAASGGAIFNYATFTQSNNGNVVFSGNSGSTSGGAIDNDRYGIFLLSGNSGIGFADNSATDGGAVYNDFDGTFTLADNREVSFCCNAADSRGGAIFNWGALSLTGNDNLAFSGNTASYFGGAIYNYATFVLSGNKSVTFSGNEADVSGGAIYNYAAFTLSGNESVTFSGNTATVFGGAIYSTRTFTLSGNGNVLFEKNVEKDVNSYLLRSIYSAGTLNLAAPADKRITFRDSVYAAGPVNLNQDYTDAAGEVRKSTGSIIFSGATTAADLKAMKGGLAGTKEEIQNSRTSLFNTEINVFGGSLVVEGGAVLTGRGITVAEGANATIRMNNGTLHESDCAVNVSSGSTLEAVGVSVLSADSVNMQAGSTLSFVLNETNRTTAALTLSGKLLMDGNAKVKVSVASALDSMAVYKILTLSGGGNPDIQDGDTVVLSDSVAGARACWDKGTLLLSFTTAVWSNASGNGRWDTASANWSQDGEAYVYSDGRHVAFGNRRAGSVSLSEPLAPLSVTVNNAGGYNYRFTGNGSLTGGMGLTKSGEGTLTLNDSNSYTGGTVINAGTVNAGGAASFGTGTITVKGGTLDLGSHAVANAIKVAGSSTLKGSAYKGTLTIAANLGAGTNIFLAKNATLAKGTVSGVLAGTAGVKVTGKATLAGENTYTGNTAVTSAGTLHLRGTVAGNIVVSGTLDTTAHSLSVGMNKTLTLNDGSVQKGGVIVSGGGNLVVNGKDSETGAVTLYNGTATFDSTEAVNVLAGNGVFSVTGHQVSVNTKGTVKSTAAAGLTIHCGSLTLTSSTDYTGTITMKGGTLNLGSLALANAIKVTVTGVSNLIGSSYKGVLTIAANMGEDTNISLAKTATLARGKVAGVLTGAAGVKVTGEATLAGKNTYRGTTAVMAGGLLHLTGSVAGKYSVAGTLDASARAIALGSGNTMTVGNGGIVKGKVTVGSGATLTVKGASSKLGTTVVNGGTAVLNSTAATVLATGTGVATVYGKKLTLGTTRSTLKMAAAEAVNLNSGKLVVNAVSSTYTGNLVAKGGTLDLASRTVKNNVYLYKATLAHAGALRGTLCVRDAAARYSGSLTLTSNNKLNFSAGSKLTVTGTLTLKGGTALTLAGSGWRAGSYTLMSAGTLSGKAATAFKVAKLNGFTSAITSSGKNVVLTLRKAAAKAAAAPDLTEEPALAAAPALVAEPMAEPTATTAAMADALVQADWAVVDATRAFTGGIRNRSTGTLTPDGKGAVWMNAIGSPARHSSVNGHSGSQVNLYGGAVGAEHHIGEHHSIGAAVGGTHANIGNTPMGKLRQNTTHIALYGNSRMGSKFSAAWAAAFGSTNAHGNMGGTRAKWQQNSTELSARLTYAEMLNDNTQLRTFAGLDYDATDADRTNGGKTGSVQALRGEFGMGLTHATETYSLYGEVGMVGDMVRHNPVAEADGFRLKGANPGRIGLKATLGGSIRLNDTWRANASYNLETAADATMQSVNVGASRKF